MRIFEYYERARLLTVDSHRQSAYISKGGPGVRVVLFCENDWHFHEFGCVFVVTVSMYIYSKRITCIAAAAVNRQNNQQQNRRRYAQRDKIQLYNLETKQRIHWPSAKANDTQQQVIFIYICIHIKENTLLKIPRAFRDLLSSEIGKQTMDIIVSENRDVFYYFANREL